MTRSVRRSDSWRCPDSQPEGGPSRGSRDFFGCFSPMAKEFLVLVLNIFRLALVLLVDTSLAQSLTNAIHRTQAATERVNDLWCYECDTMDHGPACVDVAAGNASSHIRKCKGDEFICMVKRFSYTTSTENSTSLPKMWSLDRRCSVSCEPGCIVIGERTKLYACTSCCEKSLCNVGRGAAALPPGRLGRRTGIALPLLQLLVFFGKLVAAIETAAP